MSVISTTDIANILRRTFDATDLARIQTVLDGVQGELEGWAGKALSVQTITDEEHIIANFAIDTLNLQVRPVISITQVKLDGTVWDPVNYTHRSYGIDLVTRIGFPSEASSPVTALVTYTAGMDLSSSRYADVRSVMLRASMREVQRLLDDAVGLASISSEGYSVKFEDTFTEPELARLGRVKRRTVR